MGFLCPGPSLCKQAELLAHGVTCTHGGHRPWPWCLRLRLTAERERCCDFREGQAESLRDSNAWDMEDTLHPVFRTSSVALTPLGVPRLSFPGDRRVFLSSQQN
jgi:hypothetical protein